VVYIEDGSSVNSGIGTEMLADEGVDHLFPGSEGRRRG